MRWKPHVRFGGRAGETDQPRGWHRAPVRPYWCTDALDEVRRDVWNAARRGGMKALAGDLRGARLALWKNPEDLTANQQARLSWVQRTNAPLYRAYLLKEQLRLVLRLRGDAGIAVLRAWLAWASRSRIPSFVKLARSIRGHRPAIEAALTHGLTNARVESVNTKPESTDRGRPVR